MCIRNCLVSVWTMRDALEMKSKRMKYLKTLQHLARKYHGNVKFLYWSKAPAGYIWWGEFHGDFDVSAEGKTFREMVQALYYRVKTNKCSPISEQ